MIDLFRRNKILFVFVGLIIAGFTWYGLSGSAAPTGSLETTDVSGAESADERAILDTLLQLRSIELAGTIFNDPVFQSLRDTRTEIVPEPIGRRNPFAPFGAVQATTTPR